MKYEKNKNFCNTFLFFKKAVEPSESNKKIVDITKIIKGYDGSVDQIRHHDITHHTIIILIYCHKILQYDVVTCQYRHQIKAFYLFFRRIFRIFGCLLLRTSPSKHHHITSDLPAAAVLLLCCGLLCNQGCHYNLASC